MLVACWSAKGGSGTTVVAAALALSFARTADGAVLADLAGDAPCVLGMHEPEGPGLTEWLGAGATVPADALSRIEVEAAPGLWLLPRGGGSAEATARADVLASLLLGDASHRRRGLWRWPRRRSARGGRRGVGLIARGPSLLRRAACARSRPRCGRRVWCS